MNRSISGDAAVLIRLGEEPLLPPAPEDNTCAETQLILTVSLHIAEFGVEVIAWMARIQTCLEMAISRPPPTVSAKEVS